MKRSHTVASNQVDTLAQSTGHGRAKIIAISAGTVLALTGLTTYTVMRGQISPSNSNSGARIEVVSSTEQSSATDNISTQATNNSLELLIQDEGTSTPTSPTPENDSTAPSSSAGSVQINDTSIAVPENGEVRKQVKSDDGLSSFDLYVSSSNSGSDELSGQSSLDIRVDYSSDQEQGHGDL